MSNSSTGIVATDAHTLKILSNFDTSMIVSTVYVVRTATTSWDTYVHRQAAFIMPLQYFGP